MAPGWSWAPVGAAPLAAVWRGTPLPAADPAAAANAGVGSLCVPAGCATSGAGLGNLAPWTLPPPPPAAAAAGPVVVSRVTDVAAVLARYGFPHRAVLEQERASVEELLGEMAGGGGGAASASASAAASVAEQKWARLSLVQILRGLDPAGTRAEVAAHLTEFVRSGPPTAVALRRSYVSDWPGTASASTMRRGGGTTTTS